MINLDCGEISQSLDEELIPLVDIANICCGAYAGNKEMTENAVLLCKKYGVKISAHLGYPDKRNFGRVSMSIEISDLQKSLIQQVKLLDEITSRHSCQISYLKCHGALYHDARSRRDIYNMLQEIIGKELPFLEGHITINDDKEFKRNKLPVIQEGFADRRYVKRFVLRNRKYKDAVITNPHLIISQYNYLKEGFVITGKGKEEMICDTICFHGDNEASRKALKILAGSI